MKKLAVLMCVLLSMSLIPSVLAAESIFSEEIISESRFTPGVDAVELLTNGSFERLASETTFDQWGLGYSEKAPDGTKYDYLGSPYAKLSDDVVSGNRALHLKSVKGQNVLASVGVKLIPGVTYELSGYIKQIKAGNAFLSLLVNGKVEGATKELGRVNLKYEDVSENVWTKKIVRFTAPEGATNASLMVRIIDEGEAIWDDVSLLEETDEIPEADEVSKKPAISSMVVENDSFENYTPGTRAPGWYCYGGTKGEPNGEAVTFSTAYAYDGKQSARVAVEGEGTNSPWISMEVDNLVPGATYQLSAFFLLPDINRLHHSTTVEYYTSETPKTSTVQGGRAVKYRYLTQNTEWKEYILEFKVPDNAHSAVCRFRIMSDVGVFHMDKVSLYMVEEPEYAEVESDETFYYTEWTDGTVTAKANSYFGDALKGGYATFVFADIDGTEKYPATVNFENGEVVYPIKTEWLREKGKEYAVKVKIYKPDKSLVQETNVPIFRFDRPTYLGADGIFRKNGKEYNVVIGNGVNMELLAKAPEKGGITVVQLIADPTISFIERMDAAHKKGLLVLVNLYSEDFCGGSPNMIENTKKTVQMVMNHPALFGYKLQDEPYGKNTEEELMRGYETIRNIDPHHPVYLDDGGQDSYPLMYRYADYIDIDYYGGANADSGRIFTKFWDIGFETSKGRKPIGILQQAFWWNNYLPTLDEFRHFTYQALFSGAVGLGFHSLGSGDGEQTLFMNRPVWEEICEKWAPWEMGFMLDAFVNNKYPQMNTFKDQNALWRTFVDGGDIYAVVLNRNKMANHTLSLPLTDGEGKTSIGGFSAVRVAGGAEKTVTGTGTLSLELAPLSAEVWKITPNVSADLSYLKTTTFNDLDAYPWAHNAIAVLEKAGIANGVSNTWYGPGKNITRGDFAMFLIKALDLTASTSDTFTDVNPEAAYANEIAIGKKLGILNGLGDGTFNPEGEITRQELMAITARGMRMKKAIVEGTAADLVGFSDASVISDWAVLDVASMVRLGVVRGNADGTVNPLGNTTRAEAAVIMNRVMIWSAEP